MEVLRTLIKTQNFIPETFYKNSTYLNVQDVQNLAICDKLLRRIIEQNSKSKCERFVDFKEQHKNKLRKYKTWFLCLLLWECKFPIQVLRNVEKTISQNVGYTKFIPLVPFELENTECKIEIETKEIFPSIMTIHQSMFFNFSLGSKKLEMLETTDKKERDHHDIVTESDSYKKFEKDLKLKSSDFPNLDSIVEFLATKGFYPVNYGKSFQQISESINRDFYEEMSYFYDSSSFNENNEKPLKHHKRKYRNLKKRLGYYPKLNSKQELLRKYYSIFDSLNEICGGAEISKGEKYFQEIMTFVSGICKFFEISPTIPNFVELFNSDKFLFVHNSDYDEDCYDEFVIELNFD